MNESAFKLNRILGKSLIVFIINIIIIILFQLLTDGFPALFSSSMFDLV